MGLAELRWATPAEQIIADLLVGRVPDGSLTSPKARDRPGTIQAVSSEGAGNFDRLDAMMASTRRSRGRRA